MSKKRKVVIPTLKTKNHMQKGGEWKWIVLPCLIVLAASVIIFYLWLAERNSTLTNIEYIRSFMTSTGKLNDFSNKLSMHDPYEDIKWQWDEDKDEIKILFGRIILDWESTEEFLSSDNLKSIGSIGFSVQIIEDVNDKDNDGDKKEFELILYWKDILVERCVQLDFLGKP